MICPICSRIITIWQVYDEESKELDNELCHKHLQELLSIIREMKERIK